MFHKTKYLLPFLVAHLKLLWILWLSLSKIFTFANIAANFVVCLFLSSSTLQLVPIFGNTNFTDFRNPTHPYCMMLVILYDLIFDMPLGIGLLGYLSRWMMGIGIVHNWFLLTAILSNKTFSYKKYYEGNSVSSENERNQMRIFPHFRERLISGWVI
jgi:hypothetical protein